MATGNPDTKLTFDKATIAEKVKELVKRKYGGLVTARVDFVALAGGWRLRNDQRTRGRGRVRPDAGAGMAINYPAIRIESKFRGGS